MLGAIDGGITSFAVVAGAVGGGFSSLVVIILGVVSIAATSLAFLCVGIAKGWMLDQSRFRSGLETLLTGGGAAVLAYGAGALLRAWMGTGTMA
ncbi:VIT family protein [Thiorhodovibrio winogradskyi]|uniref:VIT family protein n=1 Tax=Thiorhodovibrio winogradskyi TaxID=77007 RepID=A0ABZ0SEE3_9GAMM